MTIDPYETARRLIEDQQFQKHVSVDSIIPVAETLISTTRERDELTKRLQAQALREIGVSTERDDLKVLLEKAVVLLGKWMDSDRVDSIHGNMFEKTDRFLSSADGWEIIARIEAGAGP